MKKLDRMLERLYFIPRQGLDAACPEVEVKGKIAGSLWATDKHAIAKHRVTELYRKAVHSKSDTDWSVYKTADKEFKALCKKDKNKAWREYKERLQTDKDMASLVRLAQRGDRKDINVLSRADGTQTEPGKQTIDLLTETHFPAATNTTHVTYNNRKNCSIEEIKDKYNDWINMDILVTAL